MYFLSCEEIKTIIIIIITNVVRNVLFIAQNHNKSTTIIIFLMVRNTPRVHTIYMNHLFLPSKHLLHINIKCLEFYVLGEHPTTKFIHIR